MKKNNHKILVVVAHPDDELLGVGGTLLKHVAAGDSVSVLILGDGEVSRDEGADIPRRADCAQKAAKQLGADKLILEQFADNQFDTQAMLSIVKVIEKHIRDIQPSIVYTHHGGDINIDHQITFEAVVTATRPMKDTPVKKLLTFETVSSTEWREPKHKHTFAPNEYNNIVNHIEQKLELLKQYDDEMHGYPHPRSYEGIRILAQKRGMEVGYKYAEAFEVIRNLRE